MILIWWCIALILPVSASVWVSCVTLHPSSLLTIFSFSHIANRQSSMISDHTSGDINMMVYCPDPACFCLCTNQLCNKTQQTSRTKLICVFGLEFDLRIMLVFGFGLGFARHGFVNTSESMGMSNIAVSVLDLITIALYSYNVFFLYISLP